MQWSIYLSGEIHTGLARQPARRGARRRAAGCLHLGVVTDHAASDAAGDLLGAEEISARPQVIQAYPIRTQMLIQQCERGPVRRQMAKQWNAAFDAGMCAALGKPYITLHDENVVPHALKEVDGAAMAKYANRSGSRNPQIRKYPCLKPVCQEPKRSYRCELRNMNAARVAR